jgi:hypothetical protein
MPYKFNPFTGTFDDSTPGPAGVVAAANSGTALLPGITFASDPNTGIYNPGADQLAVATNGTGRLFINSNGSITAPQGTFTLGTSGAANAIINSADGIFLNIDSDNTTTGEVFVVGKDRTGTSGGSELFRITEAGLVGIGTSAPTGTLHVNSSALNTPLLKLAYTGNSNNTGNILIPIEVAQNTTAGGAVTATTIKVTDTSTGGPFPSTKTLTGLHVDVSASTYGIKNAAIFAGGNVGIGTTSPSFKLHISGTGNSGAILTEDTTAATSLYFNPSFTTGVPAVQTGTNHPLAFATNNVERARIDTSGRLLVGTSSTSEAARAILQGNSFSSSGGCIFKLSRGNATPNDGGDLGNLQFTDSNHVYAANISAKRDGGTWTSGSSQPTRLEFSTTADGAAAPTERMRITSEGRVVLSSDPAGTLTGSATQSKFLGIASASTTGTVGIETSTGNTSLRYHVSFSNPNGVVGTISTNASATAYNTSSDYRLKENVTPASDGIIRLQQLKPSRFNFIADPDTVVDGFIAHEVQTIVPEAITGEKDAVDDNGNPEYQGIDQSKLVPLLTAALQEAIGEIESLKARLTAAGI